jgi:ubiquinone/menaquinone biosynthesis C-methylase UbiE
MDNKKMGFQDTIDWYNANAKKYAKNTENFQSIESLNDFCNKLDKDSKVLDAGCAAGRDSNFLKKRGLNPVGVDLSESLLKIAREKYSDIEFINANFLNLPFKKESFDAVWAHASLLHLETANDVLKAVTEFHRILKKEGLIFVCVKQQRGKAKTEVVSDKLSGHDRFFQWFTKGEIKGILESVGFKVEAIKDNCKDKAGRDEVLWINSFARK